MLGIPYLSEKVELSNNWDQVVLNIKLATGKTHHPLIHSEVRNVLRGYKLNFTGRKFRLSQKHVNVQRMQGLVIGRYKKRRNRQPSVHLIFRPNVINLMTLGLHILVMVSLLGFAFYSYSTQFFWPSLFILILVCLAFLKIILNLRRQIFRLKKAVKAILVN